MAAGPWIKNIGALVVSVTLAVALGEAAVRIAAPIYTAIYQPDPELLHVLVPDSRRRFIHRPKNGGRTIDVRIDALGFRGPGFRLERTPGVRRVAVFGDSFVGGEFSDDSATFVRRLAGELKAAPSDSVEGINAGVTGYGPDQVLLRMRRELPRLAPDAIVVSVFADNDFGDLLRNRLFLVDTAAAPASAPLVPNSPRLSPGLADGMTRAAFPSGLHRLMLVRLYDKMKANRAPRDLSKSLYAPANYIAASLRLSQSEYVDAVVKHDRVVTNLLQDHYDADIALTPQSPSARYKVALMGAVLRAMRDEAAKRNTPLVLLVIPSPLDVCDDFGYPIDRTTYPEYDPRRLSREVERLAAEAGIHTVSLWDPFKREGSCKLYFGNGDNHWNERGQLIAAKLVAEELKRQGVAAR